MRSRVWLRAACSLVWLLGTSCTAVREIPRGDYASRAERRHVRVFTHDGLEYEFDYVKFESDTLTGYRRRDTEGPVEDYATLRIPLDDVERMSARGVDWYRTGLIGCGFVATVVAYGLSTAGKDSNGSESGGGKGGIP